ncbi:hypothetical protein EP331_07470 [bacterium]|nr:MAG: hypothetical protein EP331_07470 [bacterium]
MSGQEMVVAIVAIGSGSAILLTAMTSVFKVINKWIDRKSGNSELNQKFFDDYIQFKRQVLSRLDEMETGVPAQSGKHKQKNLPNPEASEEEIIREASPRLKNMLSQKS